MFCRCLPGKQNGFTSGSFKTVLLVNNLIQTGQEENLFITGDDVQKCKKVAKQKKGSIFNLLSKSLAPSIHGHEYVKKALLCLLLGGVEKVRDLPFLQFTVNDYFEQLQTRFRNYRWESNKKPISAPSK